MRGHSRFIGKGGNDRNQQERHPKISRSDAVINFSGGESPKINLQAPQGFSEGLLSPGAYNITHYFSKKVITITNFTNLN